MSGVSAGQLRQLSATLIATAPTVNDDASKNYIVGSCVFCAFDSTFYECTDNTIGAAVWSPVSGGGSVNSVTGESVDNTDPANPVVNAWPLAGTGADLANGTIEVDPTFSGDLILQDDGVTRKTIQFDVSLKQIRVNVEDIASGEQSFVVLRPELCLIGGPSDAIRSATNTYSDSGTYSFVYTINNVRIQYNGLATPTVNDDSTLGYARDSFWIYDGRLWICTDSTSGAAVWNEVGATGGTPGGADTEVQFNDGGAFGGDANFTYDKTDAKVSINGNDSMTVNGAAITTHLQVHASDGITETEVELHRHGATAAAGAQLYGARSRGTEAAPTVVSNGDRLLSITAVGYDGTDYATGAQIDFDVSAAPGNNDMPTDIIFKTSPDGSQTLTERARIKSNGSVNIDGLTASQIVTTDASKNLQSTALLPLSLGGSNKNLTAVNGGVVWTDADSMEVTAAGTAGQVLQSNGAAAPTWVEQWKDISLSGNVTTTSDTAVSITGLSFAVEANSKYRVRLGLRIGCSGTGGLRFGHTYPADGTVGYQFMGNAGSTAAQIAFSGSGTGGTQFPTPTYNTVVATIGLFQAEYLIVTGATAGTFQVTFASGTAGQTSTVYSDATFFEYKKIA